MIVLANLMIGIGTVLDMLLSFVLILVIGRAILSWVSPDPFNPIVRFLTMSTDPFMRPLQRVRFLRAGGIDFSPLVLLALIYFARIVIAQSLIEMGGAWKMTGTLPF